MKINGRHWRTVWLEKDQRSIGVIDQTLLPHILETRIIKNWRDAAEAIQLMVVRGAPLIGVVGAYGLMLALQENPSDQSLKLAFETLKATRPTAINLRWALERVRRKVQHLNLLDRANAARVEADLIVEEDVAMCESIGNHGLGLIRDLSKVKERDGQNSQVNILTHCNAGWLATVDWGTALAPIYKAHREGIKVHVWVDETRPRNQGAALTTYELAKEGIPHTLIVDNAGGYLMQNGMVDAIFVGSDRVTKSGDVCNKIGTYLKALAANENDVPFYVAIPSSTIDWSIVDGLTQIPIEIRSEKEIVNISGLMPDDSNSINIKSLQISPNGTNAFNPSFDVTPSRFITALITEKGVIASTENDLKKTLLRDK